MGSSKAHHDYIPQVFTDSLNLSCYNIGYDGNGIILAYGLLCLIEDENLPNYIVYDVKQQFDIYKFSEDGDYSRYISLLRPFTENKKVRSLIKSIAPQEDLLMYSSLYRYNGNFISLLTSCMHNNVRDKNNGYEPSYGQLTDDTYQDKDYSLTIDTNKEFCFRSFVELAKSRNVELLVVLSPEYKTPYKKDFDPILDICKSYDINVIDYFDDSSFQQIEFFKDHCHLNEKGANLFSKTIIKDIRNILNN